MHPLFTHSVLVAAVGLLGLAPIGPFRPWEPEARRDLRRLGIAPGESALVAALGHGDGRVARLLLAAGVRPVGRDGEGRTPLMGALALRDPGLARAMIEAGASVSDTDDAGESVLGHAVRAGEVSIVKQLLDRGADPDTPVPGGGRLMVHATAAGRTASAKLMLEAGGTPRARDADGTPIAFHAVERGLPWLLRKILESGEAIETRDPAGDTLLHVLARRGEVEAAPVLWNHGAQPDWKDRQGRRPLHLALASGFGAFAVDLVERGASVHEPDPAGWTPVHLAVRSGTRDALRALLRAGADPGAAGPGGETALDLALRERDFEAARRLIDYGAGPGDWLHTAVAVGDDEIFDFLMANGADPNAERDDPPLLAAVRGDRERMVTVLLDAGARHDVTGAEGQRPLHLAVARDAETIVADLLAHGADVNEPFAAECAPGFLAQVKSDGYIKWHLKNDERVTPLMAAADGGDLEMAAMLMEHGAKASIYTSRHRYWPVGMAARRKDVRMMKLLLGRNPHRNERWVKVDLSQQRAWLYDDEGKTLYATRISSGKKAYRTRTGEFVITNKTRHHVSNIYEGSRMPYFQRLSCSDFGFHEGDVPGYPASHGCLRVPAGAASKLWRLTRVGDKVVIVE